MSDRVERILRPYQGEAYESTVDVFLYNRRCLCVMATGLGKTVLFTRLARDWSDGRVMVIAHREELIQQAAQKLYDETGEWPAIEKGSSFSNEAAEWGRSRFVVASIQSLHPGRLTENRFNDFGLIIVDEGHHASAKSKTYGRVLSTFEEKNPNVRILLVTATPDRKDGEKLLADAYSYKYPLKSAIDDGWLVEPRNKIVVVSGLDFSKVNMGNGDLNQAELAAALEEEQPLQEIAVTTYKEAGDLSTVVFCASVAQAEAISGVLNRLAPGKSAWLCGDKTKFTDARRREILKAFDDGEIQFLVNMGVLVEGWDSPLVGMISNARPTKSTTIYIQILGRGTRPLPGTVDKPELTTPELRKAAIAASDKPFVKVLDFVDQSKRHDLVSCCDDGVLGGFYTKEEIDEAKKNMANKTGRGETPGSVQEELAEARETLQEKLKQARQREQAEREQAEREAEARRDLIANVDYELVDDDLFDPFSKGDARDAAPIRRGKPVTEKQAKWLKQYGVNPDSVNRKQAQGIINKIRTGEFKPRPGSPKATGNKSQERKGSGRKPVAAPAPENSESVNQMLMEAAWR